ncbi:TPA: serine hydroxymethyltransferase [Candidatus Woesearchaeota archaeon]|nr:Pyridoxal-phosphate-dependent serine hydroxymethyltransferase [archaeon GW2011_AR15]MBS3104340.1 serine hydroxymethyltransferase [Candidatus Woesearchaeota archaeon]HIH40876.1 serine hydroxymethyltransferase [Candidatus Woesearchaeota archaeon]
MGKMLESLKNTDRAVYDAVINETKRQREGIEMIASENFVSKAVLEVVGTTLTNKYSEGLPNKRYYSGNKYIDVTEQLAINRAKKLFNAEHVNVQPHAGSQANAEVYFALLELKDKVLAMDLSHGGHLTHGSTVNFSGKFYTMEHYGVDPETGRIDMDQVRKKALEFKPKILLSGFSAYPRKLDFRAFQEIAEEVGAYHMSDIAHIAGLCAAGVHENPVPIADVVTTTTHKTLRGPRGAMIMSKIQDRLKPNDKKNLAQKIDSAVFPGMQGGPLDHVIAGKAVAFKEALEPDFRKYAEQIVKNAKALAEVFSENGVTMVSGGTDNHLILLDVEKSFGIMGKEAETVLDEVHIFTNKNMIPGDRGTPFNPCGIRLGTPAITSRGMKESEMKQIGEWYVRTLKNPSDESVKQKVREEVLEFIREFPLYPDLGY